MSVIILSLLLWHNNIFNNEKVQLASITELAEKFIKDNSNEEDEKKWKNKWEKRIEQGVADNPSVDENAYCNDVIITWLIGRREALSKLINIYETYRKLKELNSNDEITKLKEEFKSSDLTKRDKLQICRWIIYYNVKNFEFPSQIKQHLNAENIKNIINFIEIVAK